MVHSIILVYIQCAQIMSLHVGKQHTLQIAEYDNIQGGYHEQNKRKQKRSSSGVIQPPHKPWASRVTLEKKTTGI